MIESTFNKYLKGSLEFGDKAKYVPYNEFEVDYTDDHYQYRLKLAKQILNSSSKVVGEYTYDIMLSDDFDCLDNFDFAVLVRLVNLTMKGTKIIRMIAGSKKIVLYYPSWMVEEAISIYLN